ncbi:peroxiredoxin [Microscilla marina]|uniref:thioredoxin-dependent peroxiredoxin n=1 Tax=Microscilla marina ATCC 23134 TaxID=313606 RepID=A1ZTT0_MICM2|nr:peroxiredoxin [Microscilla marina]EAY26182.1 bacterioferritin comigratory protein [Microscilla marina ATCC 23134]
MALKVGDKAPDFTLPSTTGEDFNLYNNRKGKPCIIYFYPKDFTPGCTAEACDFRDNIEFFKQFDIDVLGVSRDDIETHLKFKEKHNLPFELLADTKGTVTKAFKATMPLVGVSKRITYLLDKDQQVVAAFDKLFGAKAHIQEMIKKVKSDLVEE